MKIFLASHGKLASGMENTVEILMGKFENLFVYDAYIDEKDFSKIVEQYINKLDKEEFLLFLSDIYGGSVNQLMSQYVNNKNIFLISGINLPILMEALLMENPINIEKIVELVEIGQKSIKLVNLENIKSNDEDFFE